MKRIIKLLAMLFSLTCIVAESSCSKSDDDDDNGSAQTEDGTIVAVRKKGYAYNAKSDNEYWLFTDTTFTHYVLNAEDDLTIISGTYSIVKGKYQLSNGLEKSINKSAGFYQYVVDKKIDAEALMDSFVAAISGSVKSAKNDEPSNVGRVEYIVKMANENKELPRSIYVEEGSYYKWKRVSNGQQQSSPIIVVDVTSNSVEVMVGVAKITLDSYTPCLIADDENFVFGTTDFDETTFKSVSYAEAKKKTKDQVLFCIDTNKASTLVSPELAPELSGTTYYQTTFVYMP